MLLSRRSSKPEGPEEPGGEESEPITCIPRQVGNYSIPPLDNTDPVVLCVTQRELKNQKILLQQKQQFHMDHRHASLHGSHNSRYVSTPTPQPPPRFLDSHHASHPTSHSHHHLPFLPPPPPPPPLQDHFRLHPFPHHRHPDDGRLYLPYPHPEHDQPFLVDPDRRRISLLDGEDRLAFNSPLPPPPLPVPRVSDRIVYPEDHPATRPHHHDVEGADQLFFNRSPHLPVPRVTDRIIFPEDHPEARTHQTDVFEGFIRDNQRNNQMIDDDNEIRARVFSERPMSFRWGEEEQARRGHPSSPHVGGSYRPLPERGVNVEGRKKSRWEEDDGILEEDAPFLDDFDGRNQGRTGPWEGQSHHRLDNLLFKPPLPSSAPPAGGSRNGFMSSREAFSLRNHIIPYRGGGGGVSLDPWQQPPPPFLVSSEHYVSNVEEAPEKSVTVGSDSLMTGNSHCSRGKRITGKRNNKMMFGGGSSQDPFHNHVKKPMQQKPSVLTRLQFAKPAQERTEEHWIFSPPLPSPPPCLPDKDNLEVDSHVELDVSFKSNALVAKEILTPPSPALSKKDGKISTVRTPKGVGKETLNPQSSLPNYDGKASTMRTPNKEMGKQTITSPNLGVLNSGASAGILEKSVTKKILVPTNSGLLKSDGKATLTRNYKKKVVKEVLIPSSTVLPLSDSIEGTPKEGTEKDILFPSSIVGPNSDIGVTEERPSKMVMGKEILVSPRPIPNSEEKIPPVIANKKVKKKKTKKQKVFTPVVQSLSSLGAREEICKRPTLPIPYKHQRMHSGSTLNSPPNVPVHSPDIPKGSILISHQEDLVNSEASIQRYTSTSLKNLKCSGNVCNGPMLTSPTQDLKCSEGVHEQPKLTTAPRDKKQSGLWEPTGVYDNELVSMNDASSQLSVQGVMLLPSLGKSEGNREDDHITSGIQGVHPENPREEVQVTHDAKDVRNHEHHLDLATSFKEISPMELDAEEQVADLLDPCNNGEGSLREGIINEERKIEQLPELSPPPEFGSATNGLIRIVREYQSSAASVLHSHAHERSVFLHEGAPAGIIYSVGEREQEELPPLDVSAEPEVFGEEKINNDYYSRAGLAELLIFSGTENTDMMPLRALPVKSSEINLSGASSPVAEKVHLLEAEDSLSYLPDSKGCFDISSNNKPYAKSNKKDDSILKSNGSSTVDPRIRMKLDMAMLQDHSIPQNSLSSQKARRQLTGSLQVAGSKASTSLKPRHSSTIPSVLPRQASFASVSLKPASSSHSVRHRTWHRTDAHSASPSAGQLEHPGMSPSCRQSSKKLGKPQPSYIRKGNSLIRKSGTAVAPPRPYPAMVVSNQTSRPETNTNMSLNSKVNSTDRMDCSKSGVSTPFERPKTPPLPLHIKSSNCTTNPAQNYLNPPPEDPFTDVSREDQVMHSECQNFEPLASTAEHQATVNSGKSNFVNAKRMIYVKHKSNQLIAAPGPEMSNSSDNVTGKAPALPSLSTSDLYYKRNKNKLILGTSSSGSQFKQEISAAVYNSSLDGQRASKIFSLKCSARVPSKRRIRKATEKTYRQSKSSLVWTLSGTHLHGKNTSISRHRDVLPQLFPWKRTHWKSFMRNMTSSPKKRPVSLIRKLQLLRKRDTIYTVSKGGFSLRKSGILSIGGSNLKWSKSIEKHSKKANEEATLAVAEVEREKREQKGATHVGDDAKSGTHLPRKSASGIDLHQGERIFRIGTARYKMDSSKRTLIRIPDEQLAPAIDKKSGQSNLTSIVPRRLSIGNDEYIRIGNGNQLVRDPKKLVRILASEKIRWSLHTARSRLARKQQYCQFFTRFGKCNKEGGKCPYIHDPAKVAICTKFLKGLCFSSNCKLTHKVIPERMPDCSYFLQGLCTNKHCTYRHVNINPKASVCEGFLKGYCADGDECRKKHSYVCPLFEVTGECPQQSTCKLHHPKRGNKCRKRKRSVVQNYSKGRRYFGSSLNEVGEPQMASSTKHDENGDIFISEGRFADFISLGVDGEDDAIENNDDSMDSHPIQTDDIDAQIKPIRIMKRNSS